MTRRRGIMVFPLKWRNWGSNSLRQTHPLHCVGSHGEWFWIALLWAANGLGPGSSVILFIRAEIKYWGSCVNLVLLVTILLWSPRHCKLTFSFICITPIDSETSGKLKFQITCLVDSNKLCLYLHGKDLGFFFPLLIKEMEPSSSPPCPYTSKNGKKTYIKEFKCGSETFYGGENLLFLE